jgi:hypothetical protein
VIAIVRVFTLGAVVAMAKGEDNRAAEIVLKVDPEGVGLIRVATRHDRRTRESEREGYLKRALKLHRSTRG